MRSILFSDQSSNLGGGQTILIGLIEVAEKYFDEIFVFIPINGPLNTIINNKFNRNKVFIINYPEFRFNRSKKTIYDLWTSFKIIFEILKHRKILMNIEYIYINGARLALPFAFISLFIKCKYIYHVHLKYKFYEKKLFHLIAKLPSTNYVILNSQFTYDDFIDEKFFISKKYVMIENSLRTEFSSKFFKNRFKKIEGKIKLNISVIGVISIEKGVETVFKVSRLFPQINFYFIGDVVDSQQELIKQMIQKYNEQKNIFIIPPTYSIEEAVDKFMINIIILPTIIEESFGLVAIEAMALSCIVLVRPLGGLKQISSNTSCFSFSNEIDLSMIIRSLTSLGVDELLKLSHNSYKKCLQHYSFEKIKTSYFELFNSQI
jgi:hypothetical protein